MDENSCILARVKLWLRILKLCMIIWQRMFILLSDVYDYILFLNDYIISFIFQRY